MISFYIYSAADMIIGWVAAVDGDLAWALARLTQPESAYLVVIPI